MPPADLGYQVLLDVSGDGIEKVQAKTHKNGIDRFLSFSFAIPARSSVSHRVAYTVLLIPLDHLKGSPRWPRSLDIPAAAKAYLNPSRFIESDSQPVKDIADVIAKKTRKKLAQIRLAYEYPAKHLRFKPQPPAGALSALRTGIGDCTEYSALFAAICRALDIPARQTGVFNLGKGKERQAFKCPNHNAAEVYMGNAGWVPVDPNLGGGKYNRDYGLARVGNSVIVLVREGAWVWSNWLPPDGYDNTKEKPRISAEMKWQTEIIKQGNAVALYGEFAEQKAGKRSSSAK
jgi:transglutaminase-like putative cysteine protease